MSEMTFNPQRSAELHNRILQHAWTGAGHDIASLPSTTWWEEYSPVDLESRFTPTSLSSSVQLDQLRQGHGQRKIPGPIFSISWWDYKTATLCSSTPCLIPRVTDSCIYIKRRVVTHAMRRLA